MTNLKNNASRSTEGIIYQFLAALNACFDLAPDEEIYIERFGDVTVSHDSQTEVKTTAGNLTEKSENLWKTLNNWLQEKFEVGHYNSLFLLTTQKISKKSSLAEWNEKSPHQKLAILKAAGGDYKSKGKSESILRLIKEVLAEDKEKKLLLVLGKFQILSRAPSSKDLYNHILATRLMSIPDKNKKVVADALFGYVCSKNDRPGDGWVITYKDFAEVLGNLTQTYCPKNFQFPNIEISDPEPANFEERNFVKKIREIECEEEILDAIKDYLKTNEAITQFFQHYSCSPDDLSTYSNELLQLFRRKYRSKVRRLDRENPIDLSQDFYSEMTTTVPSSKISVDWPDTPMYFRNGTLHELRDSDEHDLRWLVCECMNT